MVAPNEPKSVARDMEKEFEGMKNKIAKLSRHVREIEKQLGLNSKNLNSLKMNTSGDGGSHSNADEHNSSMGSIFGNSHQHNTMPPSQGQGQGMGMGMGSYGQQTTGMPNMSQYQPNTMGSNPMGSNPMAMNPMAMNPMGSNPLGMNPLGSNPMGMNPMGMNPMGSNPMGMMGGKNNIPEQAASEPATIQQNGGGTIQQNGGSTGLQGPFFYDDKTGKYCDQWGNDI